MGWSWRRGARNLLVDRSVRLLLPLLTGMFLIAPPQSYFEVVNKFSYDGSFVHFLSLYFSGYEGFCKESKCVHLPTWNHLWFLPYVWFYSMVILLVGSLSPMRWKIGAANWFSVRPVWQLWLLPIVALAIVRLLLLSRYPSTHALIGDRFNHVTYGLLFVLGVAFAVRPKQFERLQKLRWTSLLLALLSWAFINWYLEYVAALATVPEGLRAVQRVVYATFQWSAIITVLAFAHKYLNRDHRWRSALSEAVFPLYLLHQTAIIVFAAALAPLRMNPVAEGMLLVLLTFAACLVFWRGARWTGAFRPWFGLQRK